MSYASEVLSETSLKAWYRKQEASGLIQDSSGLAHHATIATGTATYRQPSPITTDSSDFSIDYNADNFSIPDHADLDWGDTFTAEAWIYRGDLGVTHAISGRGSAAMTWGVDGATDKLFVAKADAGVVCLSTITLAALTWYYCVYTKAAAASKLYINAVDRTGAVTDFTMTSVAVPLIIGADYNGTITWLGRLDEVAFYSAALSQARVAAHFAAAQLSTSRNFARLPKRVMVGRP